MVLIKPLLRGVMAMVVLTAVFAVPAFGQTSVGVEVEPTVPPPTTTTRPPATTAPPPPSTAAPSNSGSSGGPSGGSLVPPVTTVPVISTPEVVTPAPATVAREVVRETVRQTAEKSIVVKAKDAARVAGNVLDKVGEGKPVAEALDEVLPKKVSTVVVPAVRTASTFAFPIGLAFVVIAFLILQQRIDSSDPKLIAAPIAREEDYVEFDR